MDSKLLVEDYESLTRVIERSLDRQFYWMGKYFKTADQLDTAVLSAIVLGCLAAVFLVSTIALSFQV